MFGSTILPRGHEVGVDLKVLGIAFGIAAITSLVFGVLPALHLSRTNHLHAMGSRGSGTGRGESRMRAALVVGQLVLATVLLVGAGLLTHSFVKLSTFDKGYDPSNVLAFNLLFPDRYRSPERLKPSRLCSRGFVGPERAVGGLLAPRAAHRRGAFMGRSCRRGEHWMRCAARATRVRSVSDGYLTAMGVPVLDGRELETGDRRDGAAGHRHEPIGCTPVPQRGQPCRTVGRLARRQRAGSNESDRCRRGPASGITDRRAVSRDLVDYRQFLICRSGWGASPQGQNEGAIGFLCSRFERTAPEPHLAATLARELAARVRVERLGWLSRCSRSCCRRRVARNPGRTASRVARASRRLRGTRLRWRLRHPGRHRVRAHPDEGGNAQQDQRSARVASKRAPTATASSAARKSREARLRALPFAVRCKDCEEAREVKQNARPSDGAAAGRGVRSSIDMQG